MILTIQWFIQPYKANLAEAFCLTVLVILLCLEDSNNLITPVYSWVIQLYFLACVLFTCGGGLCVPLCHRPKGNLVSLQCHAVLGMQELCEVAYLG